MNASPLYECAHKVGFVAQLPKCDDHDASPVQQSTPGSSHLVDAVLNPFGCEVPSVNQNEPRLLYLLHLPLIGGQLPLKGLVFLDLVLKVCGVPVVLISCNL